MDVVYYYGILLAYTVSGALLRRAWMATTQTARTDVLGVKLTRSQVPEAATRVMPVSVS